MKEILYYRLKDEKYCKRNTPVTQEQCSSEEFVILSAQAQSRNYIQRLTYSPFLLTHLIYILPYHVYFSLSLINLHATSALTPLHDPFSPCAL